MNDIQPNTEIEAMKKERDEARVECEKVKSERNKVGMEVRRELLPKLDKLQKERDAALAACAEIRDRYSELREFVRAICLDLQKHRGLSDAQKDAMFQRSYHLYCEHDVEHALSLDCGKDFVPRHKLDIAEADRFELGQWLRNAERILGDFGYARCNVPACNCNSYHQTDDAKRWLSPEKRKVLVGALTAIRDRCQIAGMTFEAQSFANSDEAAKVLDLVREEK